MDRHYKKIDWSKCPSIRGQRETANANTNMNKIDIELNCPNWSSSLEQCYNDDALQSNTENTPEKEK